MILAGFCRGGLIRTGLRQVRGRPDFLPVPPPKPTPAPATGGGLIDLPPILDFGGQSGGSGWGSPAFFTGAINAAISAVQQLHQALCNAAPDGRTIGLNGALGVLAGVAAGAEIVFDYHTGQTTLVLSGGMASTGAAAQVGASTGFIFGTGDAVPNYASGGNTTVSASLPSGLGGSITMNSPGTLGNPANLNGLSATAVQIGLSAGLVDMFGGFSVMAQNTLVQVPLGSLITGPASALSAPFDVAFTAFQQICPQ